MNSKEILIEKFLNEPIKIGDMFHMYANNSFTSYTNPENVNKNKKIVDIFEVLGFDDEGNIITKRYNENIVVHPSYVADKLTYKIGINPFPTKRWESRISFYNSPIDSLLNNIGYDRVNKRRVEVIDKIEVNELNWNPYFLVDGNKIFYQREFCWNLNDKQLLIESIINGIEIGKIVFRKRSYDWIVNQLKNGNNEVAFKDIVDGKQRLNAILGFVTDEYPDIRGHYFSEYSRQAQHSFTNFQGLSHGEMGENSTDEDVKSTFLNINFSGVQMSQEHIEYVKSINL